MSMFKTIPVTYPKRRKKKEEFVIQEIQEPVRKTMYDVMVENFRALKRVTFMHRIIYAGEHFQQKDENEVEHLFHRIIDIVNDGYTAEKLTGFLLCYNKYFIHLVEGDEDSINKHLAFVENVPERTTHLGVIKLLIHVSHISRRLMSEWTTYYGVPAQYLGKINIDCGLEESARHVYNCIRRMYSLVFIYTQDDCADKSHTTPGETTINRTVEEDLAHLDMSLSRGFKVKSDLKASTMSMRSAGQFMASTDRFRNTLPEYEIVDFVIKSNFTEDITRYAATYGVVPQRLIYKDQVWPCHMQNIPYDVFSKPYDTITELMKSSKPEDKEKAESEISTAAEGTTPK